MAVYDIDGNLLTSSAYDVDGNLVTLGYDIDGNIAYNSDSIILKVMAFNVGCFYTEYFPCPDAVENSFYQRHQTIFGNYNPDICGMPEWYKYIGTIESANLMDEYWSSYVPNYEAYNGSSKPNNAITFASTYTISNPSIVRYATQNGEVRYYQKGYINVDGKSICIANTHLALNSAREDQFEEYLDMLENEEYFIATGDFNFQVQTVGDSEYNASIQLALDRGFNSAQNANSILKTWYSGQTEASSTNKYALDNIITSSNIDIAQVLVDTTKLTDGLCTANSIIIDHLPLVAYVVIND